MPHRLGFFHRVRSCFFDWDALEQRVGVRAERLGNQLGRRGLGDAKRAFPILGVRVHLDGLLGLVRLDERHLRLAELALVLQEQSALQANLLDLRRLVPAVLRQRERVLEVAAGAGVLDAGVQQPELLEQRRALLGPVQRPRPRVRHLLRGGSAPPRARGAHRLLPRAGVAVHLHGEAPVAVLRVQTLGFFSAALLGERQRELRPRRFQGFGAVPLSDQTELVIEQTVLLVHRDREVVPVRRDVRGLGVRERSASLERSSATRVQIEHGARVSAPFGDATRGVPVVVPRVHLHRAVRIEPFQKTRFRDRERPTSFVVLRQTQVRGCVSMIVPFFRSLLRVENLQRRLRLPGFQRALDRFRDIPRLDVVVRRLLRVRNAALVHQVVAPPRVQGRERV